MTDSLPITVLISTTVVVGIGVQVLARWLQTPSIVLLLLFGIILGSSGLELLEPSLLGSGLEVIVSLASALILFEGGLNLQIRDLSSVSVSLRNLVTVGVLITFSGGAITAHMLSQFPWMIAFLYASLVVVTGPTVVTPLLKLIGAAQQAELQACIAAGDLLPLLIERDQHFQIMLADEPWQAIRSPICWTNLYNSAS